MFLLIYFKLKCKKNIALYKNNKTLRNNGVGETMRNYRKEEKSKHRSCKENNGIKNKEGKEIKRWGIQMETNIRAAKVWYLNRVDDILDSSELA